MVDNDADPAVKHFVERPRGNATANGAFRYIPAAHNPDPAGGFSIGFETVLATDVTDDDLIVLLDDNDPPWRDDTFEALVARLDRLRSSEHALGSVGVFRSLAESK